ncbi:MAG: undecaprenyldiphospho-muramoylpentapeptide beta-N-acetylglucosaminyltransferase [Candidatus Avelusimicrobium sp.]|uniref:undecaprenyldiphospho-muramoylpentapeptide beta-N-acetylglucosaminyltransferase n=1 Tax=Candidatus Avelusimicrobium sp. TaxID=3048833 RepID=UPI003F116712
MNRRFIIASGGTGGHFYPGFALGKQLRKQGLPVLFIIRKNDPAAQTLDAHKLRYKEIDFTGFPRSVSPLRHIRFWGKFAKALWQTRAILKNYRPDVAVGTGGYISFPLIFTAHLMGIKTAVHDSNARLGLANKICGKFSDLFMLGLPVDKKIKKSVLTSTPIRREFADRVDRAALLEGLGLSPDKKTVLIVGGSQGAKGLNNAVAKTLKQSAQWQFVHITGERWFGVMKEEYAAMKNVAVLPYSHEIYAIMKIADLAICRSGASTLAELIYCRVPAILVPFPHAAADHQFYNAKILEDAGCALIVREDKNLTANLQLAFSDLLKRSGVRKLSAMRRAYHHLNIPNPMTAAKEIVKLLRNL